MRFISLLFIVYGLIIVFGQAAMSQTADIVPDDASSPSEESLMIISSLQGDWVIEPHVKKSGSPSGNCTMSGSFDNGIQLAFKSNDGQISALRVNGFQNPTGEPMGYIGIGLNDNTYGLQSRSTPMQIDASLLTVPAPAQAIMELDAFSLKIGTDNYLFSTYGFNQAYNELISCENKYGGTKIAVVSDPVNVRAIKELQAMMPAEPVLPVLGQDLDMAEPLDVMGQNSGVQATVSDTDDVWTAERGERLEDILKRWTDKAQMNLVVDIGKNPLITNDFSFSGDINTAVNLLIAENNALQGLNTTIQENNDVVADLAKTIDTNAMASKVQNASDETERWRALQGTNLRKVLTRWAQKENIDFVWDSDQEFFIRESLKKETSFNDAVAALIDQFSTQQTRPVAILNNDPATGKTSLIIQSSRNS